MHPTPTHIFADAGRADALLRHLRRHQRRRLPRHRLPCVHLITSLIVLRRHSSPPPALPLRWRRCGVVWCCGVSACVFSPLFFRRGVVRALLAGVHPHAHGALPSRLPTRYPPATHTAPTPTQLCTQPATHPRPATPQLTARCAPHHASRITRRRHRPSSLTHSFTRSSYHRVIRSASSSPTGSRRPPRTWT